MNKKSLAVEFGMDKKREVLHYPRLDTILMVEKFIKDHSGEYSKKQVWDNLPRKVMYQTYCVIFDYLLSSGKIIQDKKGKVIWIWDPELVERYGNNKELKVRDGP